MTTSASPIGRHGSGRRRGPAGDVGHGSHLPGKVQAGRCRVRAVRARMSSRVVGRRAQVELVEDAGAGRLEAVVGGHATCPPGRAWSARVRRHRARIAASAGGAGTSRSRAGCPGTPPPRASASPGGSARRRPRDGRIEAPRAPRRRARGRRGRRAMSARAGESIGLELDLDRPRRRRRREVEAGVDGQPVEPGVEPVRVAKPGQVPPGPDQRLLDRVARELRVPEDEAGCRVQPRERRVDERARRRHDRPASPVRRGLAGPRSPR